MKDFYLDSNLLYPYFESLVKLRSLPKVFQWLYNKRRNYNYFVSNLTKIEIFRHLHTDFKVNANDCNKFWSDFKLSLGVKEIQLEELIRKCIGFFDDIAKDVSKRPSGKNLIINIMHTKIARESDCFILTGDKKLKEQFEVFYPNIISYEEMRKKDSIGTSS